MIPMVNLKRQYETLKGEIDGAIGEVLEKGQFILGENVSLLEKEIARYHGTAHGIGVANGTDALLLALRACGVGKGDEVVTTPFTFIATAEVIAQIGAVPVFVDIERDTFNMDPSKIEEAITPRTKALLPVHLFGHPAEMDPILDLARTHGLRVIEDCAQAFGAEYRGKKVGTLGDCGCFSFFPSKNLACYGDGGMVITAGDDLAKTVRMLRNHGTSVKYHHSLLGYNSRLDEIQAAILRVKLKRIDVWNESRRRNAALYGEGIRRDGIVPPAARPHVAPVYHQYTLRCGADRGKLAEALGKAQIASAVYYPVPLHLQEVFSNLPGKRSLPESEAAAAEVLSLPMCPDLSGEEIRKICHAVNSVQ
jgi:dTDP-4-amino-4,6-dideoxygalactose transaminase